MNSLLWEGPGGDGPNGGCSYSLLCKFLSCRERFRLLAVEGLKPAPQFNHRIEYGSLWHEAEHGLAAGINVEPWQLYLKNYAAKLCKLYPLSQKQIVHWYEVARVQFSIYIDYWARHKDVTQRRPLLQEQVFSIPYKLPSGRIVRLRGKWDAVDLIGGDKPGIYLFETKTKGDINEYQLTRQLSFDAQTMIYVTALSCDTGIDLLEENKRYRISGVRYNVIRRPLSGGKYSISRHKPTKGNPSGESSPEFYARLASLIKEDPGHFFMRWTVTLTPEDIVQFRRQCLDPILEQLCDWWEWISKSQDPFSPNDGCEAKATHLDGGHYERPVHSSIHWRHPFGVRNSLDEGYASDLDNYLATGSTAGLAKTERLFQELD